MSGAEYAAWVHEIQAISQNGLEYASDPYDRDRYAQLQRLAVTMMAATTGVAAADITRLYASQSGYATPKAAVRGAAFRDGKLLLVRETADQHRWTLPGGWSDVALTPAENVAKEMREETGFVVVPQKLAAAFDRNRQGMSPEAFHVYILFFICEIVGGVATTSSETSEIRFFAEDELPEDLSVARVSKAQLHLMFAHFREPGRATDFD